MAGRCAREDGCGLVVIYLTGHSMKEQNDKYLVNIYKKDMCVHESMLECIHLTKYA